MSTADRLFAFILLAVILVVALGLLGRCVADRAAGEAGQRVAGDAVAVSTSPVAPSISGLPLTLRVSLHSGAEDCSEVREVAYAEYPGGEWPNYAAASKGYGAVFGRMAVCWPPRLGYFDPEIVSTEALIREPVW